MSKKAKIWIGVGSGCAFLACLVIGIAFLFLQQFSKYVIANDVELENISVRLNSPYNLKIGEEFVLEVSITNTGSAPQELDSIDLYPGYLDGMTIQDIDPVNVRYREISNIDHYYSFDFKREIPAHGTVSVKFAMTAVKAGSYRGPVFVCVNSPTLCNTYQIQAAVGE